MGVRVVPAVEISSIDAGGGAQDARELHILGYLIDHTDPSFTATLTDFLADRERRTLRMADALREQGLELDDAALSARIQAGQPIGRPHLAEAVLSAPANAARLKDEDIDDIGSLDPRLPDRGTARLPPARDARPSPRRSTRSTPPAAWPSGRTRSGTSPTPTRS